MAAYPPIVSGRCGLNAESSIAVSRSPSNSPAAPSLLFVPKYAIARTVAQFTEAKFAAGH